MKHILALFIIGGLLCGPAVIWAGEKEDFQTKLESAMLVKENSALRDQLAQRELNDVVKAIQEKGYLITNQGGKWEVIPKPIPEEKKPEKKKEEGKK